MSVNSSASVTITSNHSISCKRKPGIAGTMFLFIFIAGYLLTFSRFNSFSVQYFMLTILALYAGWLFFSNLTVSGIYAPYFWTLLLIFGSYFIQFYWIVIDPDIVSRNKFWNKDLLWLAYSKQSLIKAYATATYGFITFCLTGILMTGYSGKSQRVLNYKPSFNYRTTSTALLFVLAILMVVTFYMMYITGISKMGAESVYLPFRLAGLIFYTRFIFIPGLFVLLIWCSDRSGSSKHFNAGIALLILHGISDMLLRASRGALLGIFIGLIILFLITGRLNKKRLLLFISVIIITSVLYPLVTTYRSLRAGDVNSSIAQSLQDASEIVSDGSSGSHESMSENLSSMFFRGGMPSIIPIVGTGMKPLGLKAFQTSVTRFFTVDVLGYAPDHITGSAPSLIGWFYIAGGNISVIAGVFIFTSLSFLYWQTLFKLKLKCLPVAQAIFIFSLFNVSVEGTLEGLDLRIPVLTASILICEMILRIAGTRPVYLVQTIASGSGTRSGIQIDTKDISVFFQNIDKKNAEDTDDNENPSGS